MKIFIIFAALGLLPLGYLSHDWITQNSRYELLRGVEPNWQADPKDATLRIDRRTGDVWKLEAMPVNTPSGTAQTHVWMKIVEETDPSYKDLMRSMIRD